MGTAWLLGALCTFVAVGGLLLTWHVIWTRRQEGLFCCKIRVSDGWHPDFAEAWPKRNVRATWVRDVLIVFHGWAFVRVQGLAIACAQGSVHALPRQSARRLGRHPVALDLVLDEGARLEVAAPMHARTLLCGPFLVPQLLPNRGWKSSR